MSFGDPVPGPVVLNFYGNGSQSQPANVANDAPRQVEASRGVSFPASETNFRGLDPHQMAAEQPELWARYINEMWPRDADIIAFFDVDPRTVRNWRNAAFGPRAHHQRMALRAHPEEAWQMLIAAE